MQSKRRQAEAPAAGGKGRAARKAVGALVCAGLLLGSAVLAGLGAEMFIYPAKGQTQDKQNQDQYECHEWAVKQSGVDPAQLAEQMSAPETRPQRGGAVRGAAGGAALGAIGGAIGGDAGEGAAIGAGVGGLLGHMRARQSVQEQQQAAQQQHAAVQQQLGQYDKAYATCLRGRGYTVSE